MHNYHFVHRDIKPENFMYNLTLKRYVLIDYGISQPIEEGSEHSTITTACGTHEFMTKELKILYSDHLSGKINVYEADMFAYDKTVGIIKGLDPRKKVSTK